MRRVLIGGAICGLSLVGFAVVWAQNAPQSPTPSVRASLDVPAYHGNAPHGPLPATLDPKLFPDPLNQSVYALAAKEKKILYQQPCYCHCDRAMGHNSLHSCFEGTHGATCSTCMREAVYAYEETRKGETPAQIRAGIERGEWQTVDLLKVAL